MDQNNENGDLYGTFSAQTSYFDRNYSTVLYSSESKEMDAFVIDRPNNDQLVDDPGIYFDRQADWKVTTTQSEQLMMFESPEGSPKLKRSGTTEVLFKIENTDNKPDKISRISNYKKPIKSPDEKSKVLNQSTNQGCNSRKKLWCETVFFFLKNQNLWCANGYFWPNLPEFGQKTQFLWCAWCAWWASNYTTVLNFEIL